MSLVHGGVMFILLLVIIIETSSQDIYRSAYHVQPVKNWLNDPNGPLYYKGYYHLFYQYSDVPYSAAVRLWDHVYSTDMVHWKHLPIALSPDTPYDISGVWSGSATILNDGTPVLVYTGLFSNQSECQCVAYPENPNDLSLAIWTKPNYNPIISFPPPQGNTNNFRDPSTAWQENGLWHMITGTEIGGIGATLLYTSPDFKTWTFYGPLYKSSTFGGVWECPDFFSVTANLGDHVLKVSAGSYGDIWMLGSWDKTTKTFTPTGKGVPCSYGQFYASKSFYDPVKKRQIQWSWVAEEDNGGPARGWQGIMTLPTVIGIDNNFNIPTGIPIEELAVLRSTHVQVSSVSLTNKPLVVTNMLSRQVEILAVFTASSSGTGNFGVRVFDTGTNYVEISYVINNGIVELSLNRSVSGSTGNLAPVTGPISLLPGDYSQLTLHIFVDHSIIEVFGQNGRARITSRVYIPPQNTLAVSVFSTLSTPVTATSINVWDIDSI